MQTVNSNEIVEGYFIRELKNRFLCEVEVNSELAVCYVPSSCHLSNFLDLQGKRVLLLPNRSKNTRTKYSLFAVPLQKKLHHLKYLNGKSSSRSQYLSETL